MKRGFLAPKKCEGEKKASIKTASILPTSVNGVASKTGSSPIVAVYDDRTVVIQKNPLIVRSDKNNPRSPYFGYFPPGSTEPELVYVHHELNVVKAATNWPTWKTGTRLHDIRADRKFEIVPIEGKGLGMVANRPISAGELIYQERPIYAASPQLEMSYDPYFLVSGAFHRSALSRLGEDTQRLFMSLTTCFTGGLDKVPGTLSTNNLQGDLGPRASEQDPDLSVCIPTLSRANHSCTPAANYFFEFRDFSGRLNAVRDIAKGEEITIMYQDLLVPRHTRQSLLFDRYRFICACEACSGTKESKTSEASDGRRSYIKGVLDKLDVERPLPLQIEEIEKAIKLARIERLVGHESRLLFLGSGRIMSMAFDQSDKMLLYLKGRSMLEEAKRLTEVLEGKNSFSVQAMKLALQGPFGPGMIPGL